MRIQAFHQALAEIGARPCHIGKINRAWLKGLPLDTGTRHQRANDYFPLSVREGLPPIASTMEALASIQSQHEGEDGALRLLVNLADGQLVESVLLPRDGLCISSQVGCAVGCTFCMTGKSGLLRQLGSAEMLAQVVLARRIRPVKKVVFMGMGEPAHNLDNVLDAIHYLGTDGNIGHKNLVLSTVGDPRVFEKLPQQQVKPALALSLHTTKADLRAKLLPNAPRYEPADLIEAGEAYARSVGYPIQYQWTLLAGINDTEEEIEGILRLLKGKYGVLNLIPYNSVEGDHFQRPAAEKVEAIRRYLQGYYILTKVRDSAGQDVDGGCGQLRARAADTIDISRLSKRHTKLL
ncbi:RNA methyltransferase [Leeia sp. TBRC 13508]|uniref:RNA methyltransferase n=1 Tax=Leeia speluncae TaxID=2884804 RepID=A0ABS8D1J5_9NEIS|nr:RNA methyltransferase [Leeia speluncae]MCB6182059.1 RNA methyltransferase [Leeia speluncae]